MSGNLFDSFKKSTSDIFAGGKNKSNLEVGGGGNGNTTTEVDDESEAVSETSWTEELSNYCPKLTFQERLIGFAACFGMGYLIAFFSFRFFVKLVEGNPLPFAVNYTVGHILQLLSSMFLCGPQRQFRNMFDAKRYMTSMVYLSCLAATLVLIFIPLPSGLKLFLLLALTLAQFLASCWYTLSYIPYGRRTALRLFQKVLGIQGDYSNIASVLT